jgi:uncharacterized membrane protein YagU involved in acid resistance
VSPASSAPADPPVSALIRAWLFTAIVDFLWAVVLTAIYGSTFARLWQGVASTLLGPGALQGGTRTVVIGIVMHFGVALAWSLVFFVVARSSAAVRRVIQPWRGRLAAAAVYGPFIWVVMSCVVIPLLTSRPPAITYRWWIQLAGHFPFVGLPLVAGIASASAASRHLATVSRSSPSLHGRS